MPGSIRATSSATPFSTVPEPSLRMTTVTNRVGFCQ
jgi:hypothetical protein